MSVSEDSTTVVIDIGLLDLNELKRLTEIAINENTTYISHSKDMITDMAGVPVTSISNANALEVFDFVQDEINPVLTDYNLDMNNALLMLTFSETVEAESLNISVITLQSSEVSQPDQMYTLTDYSSSDSIDGTILLIDIGIEDLNSIKKIYQLATTENNTFLSIQEDLVNDMVGLNVNPITNDQAKRVLIYEEDMTSPVLLKISLNLSSEILSLTFDETVNVNSLNIERFTIQSWSYNDNETDFYSVNLKNLTELSAENNTVLSFKLDYDDLNDIKLQEELATNDTNSWLKLKTNAIFDMSFVPNSIMDTIENVDIFYPDSVNPNLKSFLVNLDEGIIVMNFDEPVKSFSLNYQSFTLHSSANTSESGEGSGSAEYPYTSYTLTDGYTDSTNGLQITINLTTYDLNNIKQDEHLFTNRHTSYLSITEEAIDDMNDNKINPIDISRAIMAYDYISDTTPPVLIQYDLDMNTGILLLYFPETVDVSTTEFEGIVIQRSSNVLNQFNKYMLTDGRLNMTDDSVMAYIQITHYDLNEIKQRRIALTNETTWLTVENSTLLDMNDQPLSPLINGISAKLVTNYYPDVTRPKLQSFDLDLNSNTLFMSFSETVDGDYLNISAISIQDTVAGDYNFNHYTLNEDSSYVNESYGPNVTIAIGLDDINNIKEMIELAIDRESTFVSITDELVYDVFENSVIPITSNGALQVSNYYQDMSPPTLDYYDLDMNDKTLTLYFSETMNGSSIDVTQFTLYEVPTEGNSVENFTLNTSISNTEFNSSVTIDISENDFNEIKKLTSLATNQQDTYLSFTSYAIQDVDDNLVIPIDGNEARKVRIYTKDNQRPVLRSFDLDMNGVTLQLTFSETVNISSIDYTQITFQSNSLSMSDDYTLQYGVTLSSNGPVVIVSLLREDEDNLKRLTSLATELDNTYISISYLLIQDMDDLYVENSTLKASNFSDDVTPPELGYFNLNLTSDTLTLSFSETVNASSFDVTQISLQGEEDIINSTNNYDLTDSTLEEIIDDPVIVIMLSFTDRNEIKRLTNIATMANNTFLSLTENVVNDMVGISIFDFKGEPVKLYTADKLAPTLISYEFDLDNEVLIFNFTETVNINTIDLTQISFHGTKGTIYQLTGGIVLDIDHTYKPTVLLNDPDLNAIKFYLDIGVSVASTRITFTSGLVEDMNKNPVNEVDVQLMADSFESDKTSPELVAFDLDLTERVLTLTFTETVAANSLNPLELTLLSSPNVTMNETFTFTTYSSSPSINGTVLELIIGNDDFNNIARNDQLAVSRETTFLAITSDAVHDMNNLDVTEILQSNSTQVNIYTQDTEPPTLDYFSINFTSEILSLTFSETVNISSLDVSAITIQSDKTDSMISVQLSVGIILDGNDPIVNIQLVDYDLNDLKSQTDLATTEQNTFISVLSTLVNDMTGNSLIMIDVDNATIATEVGIDTIEPELLNYDLDMNTGYMTLYFSESVNSSSIMLQAMTFQNTQVYSSMTTVSYMVDNDAASQIFSYKNGIELKFQLASEDLSNIKKFVTLATSGNDTYLSITEDFITDQFDNMIMEIPPSMSLRVTNFTDDTNCPYLSSSEFDLNQGILKMTFSEPVDTSTFNQTELYYYMSAEFSDIYHQITSTVYDGELYTQYMTIKLSDYDLNTIKTITTLGTATTNTYIYLSQFAIEDSIGNMYCSDTIPQAVSAVIEDNTPPEITNFTLDMDRLELYLTFSESVQHDILDPEQIVLLSDEYGSDNIFMLRGGITSVQSQQPHIVILSLTDDDANDIKHIITLATDLENTYLAVSNLTVRDYSDNYNIPIYEDDPMVAMDYKPDNTTPEILYFDLNMDEGTLVLTLSEVINISSINTLGLTIQSDDSILNDQYHTIMSGNARFADSLTKVIVEISAEDLNIIKEIYTLANDKINTYLSVQSFFVVDNVGLQVDEIKNTTAIMVTTFNSDQSAPQLTGFALNLTSEVLTVTFDETVNIDTFSITGVTIQSDDTSDMPELDVTLTTGNLLSEYNSTVILIQLNDIDLHNIKRNLDLATSDNNTCMTMIAGSINDMASNPLVTTSLCTELFTPDEIRPRLIAFGANVNTSELFLRFDEPIDIDSIDVALITLQSVTDITDSSYYENYTLTEGNVSSTDLLLFTVTMSNYDLNEIKKLLSLLRGNFTTNIIIPSDFATDLNDNPVQPILSTNALTAETFYDDSERPYLQEYDIDMNNGLLTLYFSETVDSDSFNITGLTLQMSSLPNQEYTLQIQNVITPADSPTLIVLIANDDLNVLKTRKIALTEETTFLRMTSDTVSDIVARSVIPLEGVMIKSPRVHYPDSNSPLLTSFELDMNTGKLVLSFNETISGSTLNVENITLTSFVGDTSEANSFTLTSASDVLIENEPQIIIELDNDDLNELKKRTNLTTNLNNTFLIVSSMAFKDVSGNSNIEIQSIDAIKAKIFVMDETHPMLVDYELDMDTGIMTLSFTETVNSSSLDTTGITLYNNNDDTHTQEYTLSGKYDYVIPEYNDVIYFKITNDDLNEIKYRDQLATNLNDTYLSMSSITLSDMNYNPVVQSGIIPVSSEVKYIPDNTPPMLETFVIDMDLGHLILNFTETVLDKSILYDYLAVRANATIASVPENVNRQHQLERNITVITDSGPHLIIELDEYDLNEIKRKDVCTIDLQEQDCYIAYRTGALTDMNDNPIQGCREL